jgi:FlaG/FlaF family flagellin (archaellin)
MLDVLCIAITIILFAVGAAFTRGCERLEKEEK